MLLLRMSVLSFCIVAIAANPICCGNSPTTRLQGGIANSLSKVGSTVFANLIQKAGLAEVLSAPGPFTVLAPSDAAFAALDRGDFENLERDTDLLRSVLNYHILPAVIPPNAIKNDLTATTLTGDSVRFNVYGKLVTVNGVATVDAFEEKNGYIYVIEGVLQPQKDLPIIQLLERRGGFTVFQQAVATAGLTTSLATPGPFTVFAPTDEAFQALPAGTLNELYSNPTELKKLVLNHIASGTLYTRGLPSRPEDVRVLSGGNLLPIQTGNGLRVNGANAIEIDIPASNGVVHVVDSVLLETRPLVLHPASSNLQSL